MKAIGTLFVISSPSGGGKTSLVHALIANVDHVKVSVSYTTRTARNNEVEGTNYFFVDEPQFRALEKQNVFLESAHVFGRYYGTSKKWVLEQLENGTDVILEIDWQGMRKVKAQMDMVSIFILPPSRDILHARLQHRAQDNTQVIEARMNQATTEISHYNEYDFVVVNDDFDMALKDLTTIIMAQRLKLKAQSLRYRELLLDLLRE